MRFRIVIDGYERYYVYKRFLWVFWMNLLWLDDDQPLVYFRTVEDAEDYISRYCRKVTRDRIKPRLVKEYSCTL